MIVVVSNTSPLNYLVLIKQEEILPALFDDIVAPPAVVSELSREDTPEVVRKWMNNRPAWLRVETPKRVDPTIKLHPGEREAIALAEELGAARVLLDDKEARRVATERGLRVAGTLAVRGRRA